MREILFKAKRLDDSEWVEGYYLNLNGHNYILNGKLDIMNGYPELVKYAVNTKTVCQYTGLTDKNGVKIFEWDVVKVEGKSYEVKYMLGQFFVGINMPIAYKRFDCEVIGNIFDNPELMKGGCGYE